VPEAHPRSAMPEPLPVVVRAARVTAEEPEQRAPVVVGRARPRAVVEQGWAAAAAARELREAAAT
jgi:hypothetical protein